MDAPERKLKPQDQAAVDRFVPACQADNRIVAVYISGSNARGAADRYSDLDLLIVTTDKDYQEVMDQRDSVLSRLGEPIFMENFDHPNITFCVLADGADCEVTIVSEGRFVQHEPLLPLLEKKPVATGEIQPYPPPDPLEQAEKLRRLIYWFWHDLSHFIKAMGRRELWFAQGQLEILRQMCVHLARLRENFMDPEPGDEVYFKIEDSIPIERLSPLKDTFGPLDEATLLSAGFTIVQYYKELAIPLAAEHGIDYPERLEQINMRQMESLRR